ncbi:MAG: ATP-binding protein [Treponema sp.]|nr:ATP-binding protein [Treponema sp.]
MIEDSNATQSITLNARVSCMDKLNAFIGRTLDENKCPVHERGQIELAAEEIFVNIALYAYKGEKTKKITVSSSIKETPDATILSLAFSDNGCPFNPLEFAAPDIKSEPKDRKTGGLGIFLVKKTMDTVDYFRKDEKNIVKLTKLWHKKRSIYEH